MTNEKHIKEDAGFNALPLEQFLSAVEKKTINPVHIRLLNVARQPNPSGVLEAELRTIFMEILNDS